MSGSGRQAAPTFAWPAFVVAASIPALYHLQSQSADQDSLYRNFGLMPYVVEHGELLGLFSSILLHGNWAHALMNAVFALGFGLPVARLMGNTWHHGLSYILFYILCGVASNVVYVGLHPGSFTPLIGASGAVWGLVGGTVRLIGMRGVLGPVLSRLLLALAAVLISINIYVALSGDPNSGQMLFAWDVHLAGFGFGLLLIAPWAALFGKRSIAEARELPPLAPRPHEREPAAPEPVAIAAVHETPAAPLESAPEPVVEAAAEPERPSEPL